MFSPVFSIFLVTVFLLVNINVVRQGSTSIIIRKNVNDTLELSIDIHLKHLYKSSTRLQLYFLEGCPIQTHIQKKMKIWSISLTTVATRINLLLFFFFKIQIQNVTHVISHNFLNKYNWKLRRVKFNAESEPLKPWEDNVQKITMRMQGSLVQFRFRNAT